MWVPVRFESFQAPMGVCRELFRFVFSGDRHAGQATADSHAVIEKVDTLRSHACPISQNFARVHICFFLVT